MQANVAGLVSIGGLALLTLIWVGAILISRPRLLTELRNWAALAFFAACAQPIAVALLSQRQQSILGAVSTSNLGAALAGEFCNLLVVLAWFVIVAARRKNVLAGGVVLGLWILASVRLLSDSMASEHLLPKDTLVIAAVIHGVHLAGVDRATFLRWARLVTRVILLGSVASIAVAPAWAFIGEGVNGYDRTVLGLPRLSGLAPHPGALSLVAMLALLIAVGSHAAKRRTRFVDLTAAMSCLILAQSNSGWICTILGLVVLAVVRHRAIRALAFTASLVILGALLAFPILLHVDWTQGSSYIETVSGRTSIWQLALDEFQRHPITGYGPAFLGPTYRGIYVPQSLQYATEGHNQFFQSLGEDGLVGVVAVGFITLVSLVAAWRVRRRDEALALAISLATVGWSLTGTPIYPSGLIAGPLIIFGLLVTQPSHPEIADEGHLGERYGEAPEGHSHAAVGSML